MPCLESPNRTTANVTAKWKCRARLAPTVVEFDKKIKLHRVDMVIVLPRKSPGRTIETVSTTDARTGTCARKKPVT